MQSTVVRKPRIPRTGEITSSLGIKSSRQMQSPERTIIRPFEALETNCSLWDQASATGDDRLIADMAARPWWTHQESSTIFPCGKSLAAEWRKYSHNIHHACFVKIDSFWLTFFTPTNISYNVNWTSHPRKAQEVGTWIFPGSHVAGHVHTCAAQAYFEELLLGAQSIHPEGRTSKGHRLYG